MSDRCEPPKELRAESDWHWLALYGHTRLAPYLWNAHYQGWDSLGATVQPPDAAYAYGYRYVAPTILPDDWVHPVVWQPIETAPKDKMILLGHVEDAAPLIGYWHRGAWREHNGKGTPCRPTHWMPLPSPPPAQLVPNSGSRIVPQTAPDCPKRPTGQTTEAPQPIEIQGSDGGRDRD